MNRIVYYSVAFTLLLFGIRVFVSQNLLYFFIPWNLFLAWLPLFFIGKLGTGGYNIRNIFWIVLWLLFFPNAPYIITDLYHLEHRPPVPLYFDLVLLFTAAWNGLLMGLLSVKKLEEWLLQFHKPVKVKMIVIACFFLCGFGIYLGRYERFNSWHILTQPLDLVSDVFQRFIYPLDHLRTWAVTVLFGSVLFLFYETINRLQNHSSPSKQ
jgi:uncharacterized membrane protein